MATQSHYLLALPDRILDVNDVPVNATVLITDWQAGFDPVSAITGFARELLAGPHEKNWRVTDRTVEVEAVDRGVLLAVASDPEVAAAFETSTGELTNENLVRAGIDLEFTAESYWRKPIRQLAYSEPVDGRYLRDEAIPLVLGIAVIGTGHPGVTYSAEQVFLAHHRRRDADREEGSVSETGTSAP